MVDFIAGKYHRGERVEANGFLEVLKETLVSAFLNQWRIELLKRL